MTTSKAEPTTKAQVNKRARLREATNPPTRASSHEATGRHEDVVIRRCGSELRGGVLVEEPHRRVAADCACSGHLYRLRAADCGGHRIGLAGTGNHEPDFARALNRRQRQRDS